MTTIELYALPMARWLVLVAVALELYRVILLGLRMYSRGTQLGVVIHEIRGGVFLVGIVLFYVNVLLIENPTEPADRRGLIVINALYALYFLSTLTGRYENMARRRDDPPL